MHIDYRDNQTWDQNIQSLAGHLEAKLRARDKERETAAPFPSTNVPACQEQNANVLAEFDAETERLGHCASVAREGYLLVDPDALRTPTVALDRNAQRWISEAKREGRILYPDQYEPSIHSEINTPPLMVRRGKPAAIPAYDAQSGFSRV